MLSHFYFRTLSNQTKIWRNKLVNRRRIEHELGPTTYQLPRECGINGDNVGRCLVPRAPDNCTMRHQIPCPVSTTCEHNIVSIYILLSIGQDTYARYHGIHTYIDLFIINSEGSMVGPTITRNHFTTTQVHDSDATLAHVTLHDAIATSYGSATPPAKWN